MLRPEERNVLELAIDKGWTQAQVAESLKMPLGTVKTNARRGLMRLREMFGQIRERRLNRGYNDEQSSTKKERLDELLAQQAVFELSAEEQIELRKLLDELDIDRETYERTAALAAVAIHPGQFGPMPEELKWRIAAAAAEHLRTGNASASVAATAAYRGFTARDVDEAGINGTSRMLRLAK